MMKLSLLLPTCAISLFFLSTSTAQIVPSVYLPILATTELVESDKVAFYYKAKPQLIGNDGSADKGGFHIYNLDEGLREATAQVNGRTKVVNVVYASNGKDYLVTFSTPEHLLRFYDLSNGKELKSATKYILAEFSALCVWKSPISGEQYVYLFGKKEVRMYVLNTKKSRIEAVEVISFALPIEAETCAAPVGASTILFGGADKKLYTFSASDVPVNPSVTVAAETEEEIVEAAVYQLSDTDYVYLIAFEDVISVYSEEVKPVGTIMIDGGEDFELSDITIFQSPSANAPSGSVAYAFESDALGKRFGVSSLQPTFSALGLTANTTFTPRTNICPGCELPKCKQLKNCHDNGVCTSDHKCACYSGFVGNDCSKFVCKNDCSGRGKCVGANECKCKGDYSGEDCSILTVKPKFETEANGADGDDPAIWIAPDPENSRIITTTKSEDSPGLSVFDLKGNKLQSILAEEPNNVDVIYSFPISATETIDLAYAGCRGDNTLCLFKIDKTGTISVIEGGSQPVIDDFDVYGSCVYRRSRDNKFFLFINSKEALYLQYELTALAGKITTTLVRQFHIGSGTQPEGCVADDDNELIFIGEESLGLWKYPANPEDPPTGILVDSVDKSTGGKLNADVEGITLIYGKSKTQGYIIVSNQGISAYTVYRRAPPHDFVTSFSVSANVNKGIDYVTNTDGLSAVGTRMGKSFPHGLLVVHDDANEKPDGSTDGAASFKLVSLKDVFANELLSDVDKEFDPRARGSLNRTSSVRRVVRHRR